MPSVCAVSGCNSQAGTDGLSFFRFPADPERRKLWEDFIGRQNWKAKDHTRICSRHFISGKCVSTCVVINLCCIYSTLRGWTN